MIIKIDINEEMYKATRLYIEQRGGDESELEQLIQKGAADALKKAYGKNVPKATRDYIDLLNRKQEKKKSVSQDTQGKEDVVNEQRTIDRQDN